ncbi:hypothetical protein DAPPUDRAFT_113135 [Daphnia pulex]|uniref:OTU domain-containing protein n=1 Tax=Daphnia pulex TaxID=6669 RepID=E9HE65_DAPPU|nr:hypothetical protein DAPPUDRAFT_113135 [Daphnia pulex]|eukprot:EFX69958.1 hypothetical protein DAPPUDRAFT_113135 [Daphnia pulex]
MEDTFSEPTSVGVYMEVLLNWELHHHFSLIEYLKEQTRYGNFLKQWKTSFLRQLHLALFCKFCTTASRGIYVHDVDVTRQPKEDKHKLDLISKDQFKKTYKELEKDKAKKFFVLRSGTPKYGVMDYHFYIRQTVVEHLELNSNFYKPFHTAKESFTKYGILCFFYHHQLFAKSLQFFFSLENSKELGKDGTYVDHHVLAAFSKEFKVSVKVFQPDGSHHFLENTESLLPTVQVAYNSYKHYYSVKCEGRAAVSAAVGEGSINPFKGGGEVGISRDDGQPGRNSSPKGYAGPSGGNRAPDQTRTSTLPCVTGLSVRFLGARRLSVS